MIGESLIITLLGMGGVFFFLTLLVCCVGMLEGVGEKSSKSLNKAALAIVLAKQRGGK